MVNGISVLIVSTAKLIVETEEQNHITTDCLKVVIVHCSKEKFKLIRKYDNCKYDEKYSTFELYCDKSTYTMKSVN